MGGNVFKDGSTRRYSAEEYNSLVVRINPILKQISASYFYEIIPAYIGKESFGDMDVLLVPDVELSKNFLGSLFGSNGNVVHNGDVWSLVFEELQIDLITTNKEEFEAALDYFSYNDYGNLRGKIIHKFGMKFGHDGLTLPVRSENHVLGTVVLSRDPNVINSVFGFNPRKFDTLEEMFEDVIRSYFFSPELFAWENMNAVARVRDKKRDTYQKFLKYIENLQLPSRTYEKDKSQYLEWIFLNFPNAREEVTALRERAEVLARAAEKFNGNLVREWTGLNGPELGNIMRALKPSMTTEHVLSLPQHEIRNEVMRLFNGPNA
jgi:hypothetical protein